MESLKKVFWEYKDGKFELTEDIRQTYTMDITDAIVKLKEYKGQFDQIPKQIEWLEKNRELIKKHYNEWLGALQEAKDHYKLDDLELPSVID